MTSPITRPSPLKGNKRMVYRCMRTQDYLVLAADEDEAEELADECAEGDDWDVSDGMEDEGGDDVYRPKRF
jgi:hypothetical protein